MASDREPPGEQDVQGIPLRSGEIVDRLLAQLPALLGEDIDGLLQRLHEALASSTTSVFDLPSCCRDSQRSLLYRHGEALPALVAALRGECQALAAPSRRHAEPVATGAPPQVLRLQDEDAFDEDAALAAIARRHASRASFPLMLLGQRFGVLFARPALDADTLPVGPRAFARALAAVAARLDLCPHTRTALYRLYDVDYMDHYPRFAEDFDALVDAAGILPGLAYVPLRRDAAPIATAVAQLSERDALQSVNRAAEALAPQAALPARVQAERREAIFAMARYLLKHGRDSNQWSECIGVADSLLDAAHGGADAPEDAERWLRRAIAAVGYDADDADRLAAGLIARPAAGGNADAESATEPVPRGVREQRCFDRLLLLDPGAMLGFSAGDGSFLHLCLREHLHDPARLLLGAPEGRHEIVFEADMLSRLVASGQAWVMRTAPAATGTGP